MAVYVSQTVLRNGTTVPKLSFKVHGVLTILPKQIEEAKLSLSCPTNCKFLHIQATCMYTHTK